MGGKRTAKNEATRPVAESSSGKRRGRSLWGIVCGVVVLLLLGGAWVLADWWHCLPDDIQATYVGRSSCAECHAKEVDEWRGSDHDRAMDRATDETVLSRL